VANAGGQVMPIIAVDSVDAARDFYVDKLGFEHVMGVVGKDGQLDFVTVVLGGARVMFSRAVTPVPPANSGKRPVEIYLQVEDVDRYHTRVQKSGVKISDPLKLQWWGDRTFKVLDPNGYEIWFFTHVAEPKPPQGAKII
jgi:PhnB protein